jgi:hypothetical protein
MKHIIILIAPDGTEIKIDTKAKITIKDMIIGEDAIFGTIYKGALINELNSNSGNCEVTIQLKADYCEDVLKSTK